MGFGVWGLGFGVFGVWGLGFGVFGVFGVWGLGFGVWGLGLTKAEALLSRNPCKSLGP